MVQTTYFFQGIQQPVIILMSKKRPVIIPPFDTTKKNLLLFHQINVNALFPFKTTVFKVFFLSPFFYESKYSKEDIKEKLHIRLGWHPKASSILYHHMFENFIKKRKYCTKRGLCQNPQKHKTGMVKHRYKGNENSEDHVCPWKIHPKKIGKKSHQITLVITWPWLASILRWPCILRWIRMALCLMILGLMEVFSVITKVLF